VAIAVQLQVQSGMGVADTDPSKLRAVQPLLAVAEILKICVGATLIVAALRASRLLKQSNLGPVLAATAATLLITAGALGLCAVWGLNEGVLTGPMLGKVVAWLGLLSLLVTGVWAVIVTRSSQIPRWVQWMAASLAILGTLALVMPPVGMFFGLLSILFWFSLAFALTRVENRTDSRAGL
jgi:hypothetical protein